MPSEGERDLDNPLIGSIEEEKEKREHKENCRNEMNPIDTEEEGEDHEDLLNIADLICNEQDIKDQEDKIYPSSDTTTTFLKGISYDNDINRGFNGFDPNYFRNAPFSSFEQLDALSPHSELPK